MENSTILVVEDDAIVALDLKAQLTALGYGVTGVAASGEQAIHMAEETRPGLVLMDVRLKGKIDGIQAAQAIVDRLDIPIVFLSAKGQDAEIKRGKALGAEEYILKPFAPDELVTRVANILKRSGYHELSP